MLSNMVLRMKLMVAIFSFLTLSLSGQVTGSENVEALQEHSSNIQENISSMRFLTDAPAILTRLDQLDSINTLVILDLDNMVPLEDSNVEPLSDDMEDYTIEEEETTFEMPLEDMSSEEKKEEDISVSKFVPFKKKSDSGIRIQFGINSIYKGAEPVSGFLDPQINTGGSWFWDFGLIKKLRLGGKDSRVAMLFGASWLINRYSFENDVVLKENLTDGPEFVKLDNVNKHPKLNVGYITVPLSLRFSLSKKLRLELGGYAGYRLHSVQKTSYKSGEENIQTQRYSDFQLNNWVYGASAGINLAGFNLVGRYSLSGLFRDNPVYSFNTFMIGTSITLF